MSIFRKTLMDYCSSCRRHLNGALVCPGCGAYAPDIAPDLAPATASMSIWEPAAALRPRDAGETPGPEPESDPLNGFEGATPAPQGRAARRRQLARWKKNQRRAVVATAVALVGGGLTFTALDRLSADRAEAATAPEAAGLGSTEEASGPSDPSSTGPDDQRSSAAPSSPATQSPASDRSDRRAAPAPTAVTPQGTRPDTRPASGTAAASDPQSRNTSSSSSSSSSSPSGDTAGDASPAPSAPAAGDSTGDSGSDGSSDTGGSDGSAPETGTTPSTPPDATSPSGLCLLGVVCIS
ncbi:hypothetical protein ACLVWQ_16845 [Streptomyces sp. CWNU-52B]|uniref:SCO2400 family protein n=1 Tax=unclassified Streptomyces TaxID=2593676 RepID=UPI0039C0D421